jgi:hypothetical protein
MAKKNKTSNGMGTKLNRALNPFASGSTMMQRINAAGLDSILLPLAASLFKDGGRVRGCGIAKRGFGKAMKRKK